MSTYLVLMILLPGVLFYVVAGKRDQLDTASGWLVAALIGLMMSVLAILIADMLGVKQMVGFVVTLSMGKLMETPQVVARLLLFASLTYSSSLMSGLVWRLFRSRSKKLNSALLETESRFFGEGLMVSKNILENFLLAASAGEVVPEMLIHLQSGKIIRGRCISYQWVAPKRLAMITKEDEKEVLSLVELDSIETISVLNCEDFVSQTGSAASKDPWHYLSLVDKRLPAELGLDKERR